MNADLLIVTERLGAKLLEAEAALIALNLGVSAQVELPCDVKKARRLLSFRKHNKKWALCYEWCNAAGEWNYTAITSAPREIRILAVDYMHPLLTAMHENIEKENTAVSATLPALDAFIQHVKGSHEA